MLLNDSPVFEIVSIKSQIGNRCFLIDFLREKL